MRNSIITLSILVIILIGATGILTGSAYGEPTRDQLWHRSLLPIDDL